MPPGLQAQANDRREAQPPATWVTSLLTASLQQEDSLPGARTQTGAHLLPKVDVGETGEI